VFLRILQHFASSFFPLAVNFVSCVTPLVCMLMLWFAFVKLY